MEEAAFREQLIKRMNAVLLLMLERSGEEAPEISMASKVERLSELGLSASEIAKILGKPTKDVTSATSKAKKRRSKKGSERNGR